ncbi:MAG: hypothetical protein MJA82_10500, partial [Clostridia bacterium]|nr:hypothetical protein [Clostridia bacterium]
VEAMPSDDITSATHTQLQNKIGRHAHSFFATLFLSQVVGEGFDPEPVRQALIKVVTAIVKAQTPEGNLLSMVTRSFVVGAAGLVTFLIAGKELGRRPRVAEGA